MGANQALLHDPPLGQWRVYLLLGGSALLYPALFWKHNLGYNIYYLFAAMGVWLLLQHGRHHIWRREERFVYLALTAVVAEAFLSFWAGGAREDAWAHLQVGLIPMLGFIPLGFLFSRTRRAGDILWFGAPLGLLGMAIVIFGPLHGGHGLDWGEAVMERVFVSGWRASGGAHPIVLGMIVATLTVVVLSGMLSSAYRGVGQWLLAALAVVAGITISIATGSRGTWLVFPLFVLGAFVFSWRRWPLKARALLLATTVFGFFAFAMVPKVQERVHATYGDLAQYFAAGPTDHISGSIGQRFEAWRLGLRVFAAHPLLGAGPGEWHEGVVALEQEGVKPRWATFLIHPHNLYVASLALRGGLGFLAEALFWGGMLVMFGRRLRSRHPEVAALARAGMVVCVSVLVYGMSDIPYTWWRPNTLFFFFVLALLFGAILSHESRTDGSAGCEAMPLASAVGLSGSL